MMKDMLIKKLEELGNDVIYFGENTRWVAVILNDCEGFYEDWETEERMYDNEELVDAFLAWLRTSSKSVIYGYYDVYEFEDFNVKLGYSSMDI